jgi:hypothetical protein
LLEEAKEKRKSLFNLFCACSRRGRIPVIDSRPLSKISFLFLRYVNFLQSEEISSGIWS